MRTQTCLGDPTRFGPRVRPLLNRPDQTRGNFGDRPKVEIDPKGPSEQMEVLKVRDYGGVPRYGVLRSLLP